MKRYCALLLTIFVCLAIDAQDISCAYNLSKITSYVRVERITDNTARELSDTIRSLRERYHSADFVIDCLHTQGDFGEEAAWVAEVLLEKPQRVAILVGRDTQHSGEQVAVELRSQNKAVVIGDAGDSMMTVDAVLQSYDAYKNEWYESLHEKDVIAETVCRYISSNKVSLYAHYPDARSLYINYDENAPIVDMLNEVALDKGIQRNDDAFLYSGYMVLCEVRAEMMRQMYPDEKDYYFRSQNLPIETAISLARDILESARYREILGIKGNAGAS